MSHSANLIKCALCQEVLSDGAHCHVCNSDLHFHCAQITESGYRKLGVKKQQQWRCQLCRQSGQILIQTLMPSSSPKTPSTSDSQETHQENPNAKLLRDINLSLDAKLAPLLSLAQEIRDLRGELADLKLSFESTRDAVNINLNKIKKLEERMSQVENAKKDQANLIQAKLDVVEADMEDEGQWKRMNNLEIKGIPQSKSENLIDIVCALGNIIHYPVSKNMLNFVTRVPSRDPNLTKPIIVCFLNRYVKDDFIAAYRAASKNVAIMPSLIGLQGGQRIFVNDHLTIRNKMLLSKVKKISKEKGFQFVWVKHCKIHVRLNDTSPVIIIKSDKDILKLEEKY